MLDLFTDLRTLVLFLVTLTVIIAVHEFGHYLTARLLGMRVLEFAFGFPPRVFGLVHAGITYSVNAIPFGGFVRILGQDDFAIRQRGEGEPGSFTSKPWWAQAIVLVAGVGMNLVLALVVLTAAFMLGGTLPTGQVQIVEVHEGSPAEAAGLEEGDIVASVDGRQVRTARDLVEYVESRKGSGEEIALEIVREGRSIGLVRAVPRAEPPAGQGPIGVLLQEMTTPGTVSAPQAAGLAWTLTVDVVVQILALPGQLIAPPPDGPPAVGGPIEILRITGQVAEFGLPTFLKLVGVLSVNLMVLNIIPFPGLDGGRLFFVLVAGIFRLRLSPQVEAAVHAVGFLVLLALLVVVSIADIRRAFGG
ncbi:MAG: M50 family metallopeptidase [Candidatus Limnocylindria bacterium]